MVDRQKAQEGASLPHQVVKAATACAIAGTLLVLSDLTLMGTVIGVTIVSPLLVIFSPLLVPAAIVVFLLVAGLTLSWGIGAAAASVMSGLYKCVKGKLEPQLRPQMEMIEIGL
ncbi:hypothetical protein CKAN_01289100 [Cinnamomum micranthum f. kanehirae]|uniref:Oleosin n=1 Tax=Cinnamomum micranthum f. kanehirae TaxID=337451 RepID=A0A3S3P6D6_9MAGN|nr:hypothetical protein CKAN_01289100 [Cinnamomum micranthum f. kanehirae]